MWLFAADAAEHSATVRACISGNWGRRKNLNDLAVRKDMGPTPLTRYSRRSTGSRWSPRFMAMYRILDQAGFHGLIHVSHGSEQRVVNLLGINNEYKPAQVCLGVQYTQTSEGLLWRGPGLRSDCCRGRYAVPDDRDFM